MTPPMKTCSKCKEEKPSSEYWLSSKSKGGLRYECIKCGRVANRVRRVRNLSKVKRSEVKYRAKYPGRVLVRGAARRSKQRGLEFDLSHHVEKIEARIAAGKCELTGTLFGCHAGSGLGRQWNVPSLDRINPELGYTYDNIRIICWGMNAALGNWGEEILRGMVKGWVDKGAINV